jgi:hypothetical protein
MRRPWQHTRTAFDCICGQRTKRFTKPTWRYLIRVVIKTFAGGFLKLFGHRSTKCGQRLSWYTARVATWAPLVRSGIREKSSGGVGVCSSIPMGRSSARMHCPPAHRALTRWAQLIVRAHVRNVARISRAQCYRETLRGRLRIVSYGRRMTIGRAPSDSSRKWIRVSGVSIHWWYLPGGKHCSASAEPRSDSVEHTQNEKGGGKEKHIHSRQCQESHSGAVEGIWSGTS